MNHCPIKGFQGTTLIDYPGKIASIVYTGGCNFRCRYCYNRSLLNTTELPDLDTDRILRALSHRRGFIEGVVVTGGEPTIHHGVIELLSRIKRLGFAVKLDTNGSHPEILEWIVEEKLADYIAMDYKAPLRRYEEITCVAGFEERVHASARLLIKYAKQYEFRTTVHPLILGTDDIDAICAELKGAAAYYIQQYHPFDSLDEELIQAPPYPAEFFHAAAARNKRNFQILAPRNLQEPSKTYISAPPETAVTAEVRLADDFAPAFLDTAK